MKVILFDNDHLQFSKIGADWLIDVKGWHLIEDKSNKYNTKCIYDFTKEKGIAMGYCVQFSLDDLNPTKSERTNLDIIEGLEKLGSLFLFDPETKYRIVEIPDDIKWYLCESEGGFEFIREAHRTWE